MPKLDALRAEIRRFHTVPDAEAIAALRAAHAPDAGLRRRAEARAVALVREIRANARPGLMEAFLAEYGLSTDEGIALMCLAEALLRVPDAETIDELIEDKITPAEWNRHLGRSSSSLVNASTWALMLTGKVLSEQGEGLAAVLRGAVKRLGEPVIRTAIAQAMKELGRQFVLGQTIEEAISRGQAQVARGYGYSYDMLGEGALTAADAERNMGAYAAAITALAGQCRSSDIRKNPGISIKLSAIHPRYEYAQKERVRKELAERTLQLARMARRAHMGFNIDAEEASRLDLSLDVIETVLADPSLAGWGGFGVVVQAVGKRAAPVIDWLHALAESLDRQIMVRLVKGAYWDSEVKQAQVEGLAGYPVYTRKEATDVAWICCAQKLMGLSGRIYPQFATHNAHSVAAVLEMAGSRRDFEFQRLHGMGEALYDTLMQQHEDIRCRIYAPVGTHRDLLAYLVRRLLENGANSSFVHQLVNKAIPPQELCADPFARLDAHERVENPLIPLPADLFAPARRNSRGFDLSDPATCEALDAARGAWRESRWQAGPVLAGRARAGERRAIVNPADPADEVGEVVLATPACVDAAVKAARPWACAPRARAAALRRASDLYEEHAAEIFALLAREAGKTVVDAVAELREAVDFLRYYAAEAERLGEAPARGLIACISPWNFPLAIFTGQIAAALAAGNAVLAKPAEATPLVAARAVQLLHEAGVPRAALQLLPGDGPVVGAALASAPQVSGVCFTGSTATARRIERAMAEHLPPEALLIAETGGINAMVVDSTALPEQAVRDIVASAFRSAGQRCSALRVLYLQEDVAEEVMTMLLGAMDELRLGDPWEHATDVGPIISAGAAREIAAHVERARAEGRLRKQLAAPQGGHFIAPAVIEVRGIEEVEREIFGPVLHVATYRAADLEAVIAAINARGFGLTFGMHSRIDDRVEQVASGVRAGNIYVNRNQIGAVVGVQPFGGEGLSGTGPKAGGPHYVPRFYRPQVAAGTPAAGAPADPAAVQALIEAAGPPVQAPLAETVMPGPTGESNRLSLYPRGVVLCLGASAEDAARQAEIARRSGCTAVRVAPGARGELALDGVLAREALTGLHGFAAVALWSDADDLRAARRALAAREGPIVPLLCEADFSARCLLERHLCIDTTAAGGNATLLAQVS